ncbi:four helix bundle protein [Rhizobium sp. PP-CC-3G-465]|nr:four helix bundle protein [Rhizobium sp. PP-CC-2G-626]TCQ28614.1 four helix bundle protein [Rhizobium sp. PP-CC-3G-465]
MDLAVECYDLTKVFPREEAFGLVSQIRRSAASIAANIAEGHGRDSTGAYVHHLKIAQGSLKELETHLILSVRVGMITGDRTATSMELATDIGKMLRALIRVLLDGRHERDE